MEYFIINGAGPINVLYYLYVYHIDEMRANLNDLFEIVCFMTFSTTCLAMNLLNESPIDIEYSYHTSKSSSRIILIFEINISNNWFRILGCQKM